MRTSVSLLIASTSTLFIASCASPEKIAERRCAVFGKWGDKPYSDCVMREIDRIEDQRAAAYQGMTALGAQMMQGPPRQQTSTTTCNAVGGTAFCTKVSQ
jgi:hypothetical protein